MSGHRVTHALTFAKRSIQIATRLLGAACPPLYWFLALSLLDEEEQRQTRETRGAKAVGKQSVRGRLATCVIAYCVVYNVLGPLLHCNFLPWT